MISMLGLFVRADALIYEALQCRWSRAPDEQRGNLLAHAMIIRCLSERDNVL